jgi:hypothetical protein
VADLDDEASIDAPGGKAVVEVVEGVRIGVDDEDTGVGRLP